MPTLEEMAVKPKRMTLDGMVSAPKTLDQMASVPRIIEPSQPQEPAEMTPEVAKRQELIMQGFGEQEINDIFSIQKKIKPSFWKDAQLGRTAGATALAIGIGQIPPFTALPEEAVTIPLLGRVLGAGVGGALGYGIETGIREKRVPAWKELLGQGGIEAGFELGGGLAAQGLKLAFSPVIKKTIPDAVELMSKYGDDAISFSPAEMDKRLSIRMAEAISKGSFGADDIWKGAAEKQKKQIFVIADQLLDTMADGAERLPSEQLGDIFTRGISEPDGQILKWMDELFDPLYAQVDELTKAKYVKDVANVPIKTSILGADGTPLEVMAKRTIGKKVQGTAVKTAPLKRLALEQLRIDQRMMKEGKGLYLTTEGRNLLETVMGLENEITFSDMRKVRTRLLDASRKLSRDMDSSKAIIKRMSSAADEALFDPSNTKNLTPEAKRLLLNTNRLYKASQKGLEQTFPEKMAKRLLDKPSQVTKEVFRPRNPDAIRKAKMALIEPVSGIKSSEGKYLWNQLRTSWYENLLDEATKTGQFSERTYHNLLYKMGDNALKEMYSPTELDGIKDIGKSLNLINRTSAYGTPLFTKGLQITGVGMLYQGHKKDSGITMTVGGFLAFGPVIFAKMATHPKYRKLLVMGLNIQSGSKGFASNAARVINAARKIEQEEMTLQQKIEKEKRNKRWQASQIKKPKEYYKGYGGRGV